MTSKNKHYIKIYVKNNFHFIHFIFTYLDRVKLQLYIHKLLYKLPCTKKKDKTLKDLYTIYKVEK